MNVVSTLVLCLTLTALLYSTELIQDQPQYEAWAKYHTGTTAGGGTRRV